MCVCVCVLCVPCDAQFAPICQSIVLVGSTAQSLPAEPIPDCDGTCEPAVWTRTLNSLHVSASYASLTRLSDTAAWKLHACPLTDPVVVIIE